ncbi:MAG: hypothetical protein ABEJ08_00025 [Halobacteriaceae archaeon]
MGLVNSLLNVLGVREETGADPSEGDYRCIRCGEYFDREYHTCPACGVEFVVAVEGDDGEGTGAVDRS